MPISPNWNNDKVQFARLLCEIAATQELDVDELMESMDLSEEGIQELFDRADAVWEHAKEGI